jgi:5-methylcytosine-specific restriction endonuclease McrA
MAFTEEEKLAVWNKGDKVVDYDPTEWRKDQCDALIRYSDYGNRDSHTGWEIDHITPQSSGGTDAISNLRPLQWRNNVEKSSGRLPRK